MEPVSMGGQLVNFGDLRDFRVTGPEAVEAIDKLDGAAFLTFMSWIAIRKETGTLLLEAAGKPPTTLGFSQGSLLAIELQGHSFPDDVVRWMQEQRIIDATQLQAARADPSGKPILQALFEQKACTSRDLVDSIKATKERLLEGLVSAGNWTFSWRGGAAVRRTDPVALDSFAYVVGAMRLATRSSYATDLDPLLRNVVGRYPYVTEVLTPALAEILLSDKERKVIELAADGTTTLKDGIAMSLLSHTQTDRLFLIAGFLGFVEFRTQGLPKGGIETLEKELKSALERLKNEDHFLRLGVHWTTHPKHYAGAYQKMTDRWGPASRTRQHSPVCAELAAAIQALMDEAIMTIETNDSRGEYRLQRVGKETIIFGTDFLYKQAHLALFREEWDLAQEIIESAIDILPRQEFLKLKEQIIKHVK